MSVWKDMAHDAGYRGDDADYMAYRLEEQERQKYEAREEDCRMSDYVPTVEERQEEIERSLEPSQTDIDYEDMLDMLKECKSCKCDGSGSYVTRHTYRDDDGTETGHSSSTHPCPCRSELPPRDGEASWWSSETVHKEVICDPLLTADIEVRAEVPYSNDNYRLARHGRRYYPTMVYIQLQAGPLSVESVASLTDALNRATAVCAEIDDPDTAPCGHWAPCDCDESDSTATEGTDNGND